MATRARDIRRRLAAKLAKDAARPQQQPDPEMQRIENWQEWFVTAHRERLTALNLPPEQFDREVADVTKLGAAVAQRMREDYLTRHAR